VSIVYITDLLFLVFTIASRIHLGVAIPSNLDKMCCDGVGKWGDFQAASTRKMTNHRERLRHLILSYP